MKPEPETFLLVRSSRRTMALEVRPGGELVVRAPRNLPVSQVHSFIARHEDWIKRKQVQAHSRPRPLPKVFTDGEEFLFLGRPVKLRIVPTCRPKVTGDENGINLSSGEQPEARKLVIGWYRDEARRVFTERVRHYAGVMELTPSRVRVTSPRRRWGSCGAGGSINLNWKLVMAPPEIIDYIVIHELAHLKIRGHGVDFRELVKAHVPDYQERERWLRDNAHRLEI